jgi:hypothetical protein
MTEFHHTSYERATREYDEDFRRALIAEIVGAIAEASICTDNTTPRIMALRIGETLEALTACMISFAALSPYFDAPSNLREFAETLARRFRREVAKGRAKGIGQNFIFGARKGGTA